MPIHALTPRLAEAGKIKIGGRAAKAKKAQKSGREYFPPVKYDEFHVTTLERDGPNFKDDEALMWHLRYYNAPPDLQARAATMSAEEKRKVFSQVKIREIPILLHSDNVDDVLRYDYVAYVGRQRSKMCDGRKCTQFEIIDGKRTGNEREIRCECPVGPSGLVSKRYWDKKTPKREDQICKPYAEFSCLINLPDAAGPGSLYKFRTTSFDSIRSLLGAIDSVRSYTGGVLTNVPCRLIMHVAKGRDERDRETKFWGVHLEMDRDVMEVLSKLRLVSSMRREIISGLPTPRALPGTTPMLPKADDADVSGEFFPPTDAIDAEYTERPKAQFDGEPPPDAPDEPPPGPTDAELQNARDAVTFLWSEYASKVEDRAAAYGQVCEEAGFPGRIRIETETDLQKLLKLQSFLEAKLAAMESEEAPDEEPFCNECGSVVDDLVEGPDGLPWCQSCIEGDLPEEDAGDDEPADEPDQDEPEAPDEPEEPDDGRDADQAEDDQAPLTQEDLLAKRRRATELWSRYSQQEDAKPFREIRKQLGAELLTSIETETNAASLDLFISGLERMIK